MYFLPNMLNVTQDWVQFEEIGELEDRFVSNYFENMLQSIHNVIGGSDVPSDSIENTAETCPIASTNDEENVSYCIWIYFFPNIDNQYKY